MSIWIDSIALAWSDTSGRHAMRFELVHPNTHSAGAEIAGNWPPAWTAYVGGALKRGEFGLPVRGDDPA